MSTTPSHQHVQPSRVPLTPPQPAVTVRPRTTLVDLIRSDPRASRGFDDRLTARTPR